MPDKSQTIIVRDPKDLKPHTWNIKFYGNEPVDQELAKSMQKWA